VSTRKRGIARARSEAGFRKTFERAADAAQRGDLETAEDVLRSAVAAGDEIGAPRAAFALAQMLEDVGRSRDAGHAYAQAAALSNPESTPDVHCNLAARWVTLGRTEDAIVAYGEIVARVGPHAAKAAREDAAVAAFRLAELLAEQGESRAAQEAWQLARKNGDHQTIVYATLALARHRHECRDPSRSVDRLLEDVVDQEHIDCSPEARLILADRQRERSDDERAYEMYALVADTRHPVFAVDALARMDEMRRGNPSATRGTDRHGEGACSPRRRTISSEMKQNVGHELSEIAHDDGRPAGSGDDREYDPTQQLAEIERRED
jgi:tetratricopeptide (TPR) repeat protein